MEKHFMQKTAATSLSQYFKSSYLQENLCLHVCFASNKRKPSYVFLEVHALNDIFKNVSNLIEQLGMISLLKKYLLFVCFTQIAS